MIKSSKYLLLVFVLTFNALFSFANPTNEKLRHFVLSAGVFKANSEEVSYSYSSSGVESGTPVPVIVPGFTVGYELNKTFEFSGYIAYSNMGHRLLLVENSDGMYVLIDSEGVVRLASNDKNFTLGSNTVFYGVSLKCNFLPIITGQENLRFSLYAISNFGLISAKWKALIG